MNFFSVYEVVNALPRVGIVIYHILCRKHGVLTSIIL